MGCEESRVGWDVRGESGVGCEERGVVLVRI